jgi:AcrR family transcriptional regulator
MPKTAGAAQARTRDRILRAVIEWAEDTGMRKLSMDEIASRAKLGRATLYIHFPGRSALIEAAVRNELDHFFATMQAETDNYDDPDERLVHTFALAYRTLRDHRLLKAVMRLNPQMLMPFVIGEDSLAIDLGREFVMTNLRSANENLDEGAAEELAELTVRSFHSFVLAPSTTFDLDTAGGAEDYAQRMLVPLLHRAIEPSAQVSNRVRGRKPASA